MKKSHLIQLTLVLKFATCLALALVLLPTLVFAGGDWFTSRTAGGQTKPVVISHANDLGNILNASVTPETDIFTATGLPVNIPDNDANGVTVNLPVNHPGRATGLTVSLHITHTYIGDLKVTLMAPSGTPYILHDRAGGGTDDLVLTDSSVAAATNEIASGVWHLFVQDLAGSDVGTVDSWSLSIASTTKADIDLVMSLAANPTGDNDGNHQGQAGSAAQDKWERIVQYFADGVYESTNGAHMIRNVRIFRSGRGAANADVLWTAAGHPHVPSKGGVGEPGGHINMYEIFTGGNNGADYDMLADEIGSGFTQAHEWGHYFYGLYDEYKINATDVPVNPSIMHSQWGARNGDYRWLNFSIANMGGGNFQDTLHNIQHSEHGASAWQTLARTPNHDIKTATQLPLGKRIFYPEVAAAAPATSATPRIDLPGAARMDLNIIWMSDENVFEIVIDHSDSMRNQSKLEQAKAAARLFIDLVPLGTTRVGVIQFDDTVQEIQPIILLSSQTVKNTVKAKIAAISPGGSTAIGDAAQLALNKILASNFTKSNRVVFLLSDGQSNTGVDPLTVIPQYQHAQIPLFTFAFGSDADVPTLQQLAVQTKGKFYRSPASLAVLTTAFHDAQSVASSTPSVAANTLLLANGSGSGSFIVDSTIGQLNLSLVRPSNSPPNAVRLMRPNGSAVTPTDTITVSNETLLSHVIINPPPGVWTVNAQNAGTGSMVTYTASGIPKTLTYVATVDSLVGGNNVAYPAAIKLRAKLFKELPINKVSVASQVIAPDGHVSLIHFHDDGAGGDELANDGNYSATFRYTQNGIYTFKVNYVANAGQAYKTYTGSTASPTVQGQKPANIADRVVGEAFSRANQIQIATSGGVFPAGGLGNISTRARVGTGDNVLIGGFIIGGTDKKKVLLRAIGPSLSLAGKLADPTLELRDHTGKLIAMNDNWKQASNRQDIINSTAAPTNDLESAILLSLTPGAYTATVRGVNNSTGLGLVEIYDLDPAADSKLVNISSRGLVQTNDNVIIGGLIVVPGSSHRLIIRALGPSIPVPGKLADPILELHDANGTRIALNDDWKTAQQVAIQNTGIPPHSEKESALVSNMAPGRYTAIVRGKNNTTGIALVEVYALN